MPQDALAGIISATIAGRITVAGGSGTGQDIAAVRAEIAKLSPGVLRFFENKGARVVACRGSVTDVERRLRGVTPRGWEGTGRTWDSVQGTYLAQGKRVVVATVAAGAGRAVPARGPGTHGSCNLAVHEAMHGHDYLNDHRIIAGARFRAAHQADHARLGPYERQQGQTGLEETYAESAARFYEGDAGFAADWPALAAFWQAQESGSQPEELEEEPDPIEPEAADRPLGTAQLLEDGAILLDLRAEDEGVVGHAALVIAPDDPDYEALKARLFADRSEAESLGPAEPVLFRPLG